MVLNEVQIQVLSSYLRYLWHDWQEAAMAVTEPEDPVLDALETVLSAFIAASKAFEDGREAQLSCPTFVLSMDVLQQAGIGDTVEQCLQVLRHPHPQNRSTGCPYTPQEDGHVCWTHHSPAGRAIVREPIGLLSLTAQNVPEAQIGKHAHGSVYEAKYSDDSVSRRDVVRQIGLQLASAKNVVLEQRVHLQRDHQLAEEEMQRTLQAAGEMERNELIRQMGKKSRDLDAKRRDYHRLKDAYHHVKQKLEKTSQESLKARAENFRLRQQIEHYRKRGGTGHGVDSDSTSGPSERVRARALSHAQNSEAHAHEALAAIQTKMRRRRSSSKSTGAGAGAGAGAGVGAGASTRDREKGAEGAARRASWDREHLRDRVQSIDRDASARKEAEAALAAIKTKAQRRKSLEKKHPHPHPHPHQHQHQRSTQECEREHTLSAAIGLLSEELSQLEARRARSSSSALASVSAPSSASAKPPPVPAAAGGS